LDSNIKTVILCGGRGIRLQEKTEFLPKPMVKIGERPILWHIMKIYAHYGFNKFILCLGYKGEIIKNYFYNYDILNTDFTINCGCPTVPVETHNNHEEHDWRVTLVDTGKNSLKGARIQRIKKYVTGDLFMLTYGDGMSNINIRELLSFHRKHGRIGTLAGVRPPSRFGELVVNGEQVLSFNEKPQSSKGLINGGFFVLNRKVFDYLSEDENCDFEVGALEQIAKDGELMVYKHKGEWACMDTYRDWAYLNRLWETNKPFWKVW
jgi:glucose-1-phosphate cytidylyltransferase